MLTSFRIAVLLFVIFLATNAIGQVVYEGCTDFRGIAVASVPDTSVPDIAMATYAPNGAPIIVYNPNVLNWVSPATRLFFYAHECAHHVLGHVMFSRPFVQEQQADCWGIRILVKRGRLNNQDMDMIQRDLNRFATGDWTHLPGPIRSINLFSCLAMGNRRGGSDPVYPTGFVMANGCYTCGIISLQDECLVRHGR
jgi:hypothetical protein